MSIIDKLLSTPLGGPVPQAPTPATGKDKWLGIIGDALTSAAAARHGSATIANMPFRQNQMQQQLLYQKQLEDYQNRQAENERANRTLRVALLNGLIGRMPKPPAEPSDLAKAQFEEAKRHNLATESTAKKKVEQPPKPREQVVYDRTGQAHILNLDTGLTRPVSGVQKPPSTAQETAVRSSGVLKLRIQEARDLIEGSSSSRFARAGEAMAVHDPTGLFSGSDKVSDAATYQSFINEIGSLTRGLYGAQGIRSYEEILRLINAMPPWASGKARVKKQFDALNAAVAKADGELRKTRPDLFPPDSGTPASPAATQDKQVGTKNGIPVYERPDGSRYMKTGD
jgi:hypothetical protein